MCRCTKLDRLNLNANITLEPDGSYLQSNTTILFSNTQNDFPNEGWFEPDSHADQPADRRATSGRPGMPDGSPVFCGQPTRRIRRGSSENEYNEHARRKRWIASQSLALDIGCRA